jgi:hypothetical protein
MTLPLPLFKVPLVILIIGALIVILILPDVALTPALFATFITPLAVVLSIIFDPLLAFNMPFKLIVEFAKKVAFLKVVTEVIFIPPEVVEPIVKLLAVNLASMLSVSASVPTPLPTPILVPRL